MPEPKDSVPRAESTSESAPDGTRRGGKALVEKYGREYMANLGKKGSRAVIKKYGLRFYSEIAARNKGVKKRGRRTAPAVAERSEETP